MQNAVTRNIKMKKGIPPNNASLSVKEFDVGKELVVDLKGTTSYQTNIFSKALISYNQ